MFAQYPVIKSIGVAWDWHLSRMTDYFISRPGIDAETQLASQWDWAWKSLSCDGDSHSWWEFGEKLLFVIVCCHYIHRLLSSHPMLHTITSQWMTISYFSTTWNTILPSSKTISCLERTINFCLSACLSCLVMLLYLNAAMGYIPFPSFEINNHIPCHVDYNRMLSTCQ